HRRRHERNSATRDRARDPREKHRFALASRPMRGGARSSGAFVMFASVLLVACGGGSNSADKPYVDAMTASAMASKDRPSGVTEAGGLQLTDAEQTCVNKELEASNEFRDLMARSIAGGNTSDAQGQKAVLPAMLKCVTPERMRQLGG